MGIFKSLKRFFVKPRPIYEMKITPEQMARYVSANVQKKLGYLQAENAHLKKSKKSLEQKIKEYEGMEDVKLVEAINKVDKKLKRDRIGKTAGLLFDFKKPVLIRSAIGMQSFKDPKKKYWKGFQFRESEYSEWPIISFIASPYKKGFKNLTVIRGLPLNRLSELVYNPQNFVQELRMRRLVINMTPDEKIIPSLKLKIPMGEEDET